jgi:hypothetical protein
VLFNSSLTQIVAISVSTNQMLNNQQSLLHTCQYGCTTIQFEFVDPVLQICRIRTADSRRVPNVGATAVTRHKWHHIDKNCMRADARLNLVGVFCLTNKINQPNLSSTAPHVDCAWRAKERQATATWLDSQINIHPLRRAWARQHSMIALAH